MLVRVATATSESSVSVARERLVFDDDAWRLALERDAPLVLRERGDWLVEHPFTPPVESWFLLPLGTRARRLGVVIGGAQTPARVQRGRRRGAARAR